MFASFIDRQKHTARRVSILKYLNTGTVTFAMFVALALLSSTHGKDSPTRESASVTATMAEVSPKYPPKQRKLAPVQTTQKSYW